MMTLTVDFVENKSDIITEFYENNSEIITEFGETDSEIEAEFEDVIVIDGKPYYILPVATEKTLGGMKVGTHLEATEKGVVSVVTTDDVKSDNSSPVTSSAVAKVMEEAYKKMENIRMTADKSYVHTQYAADRVWEISHGLNKMVSVTVVDSAGTEVVGDVEYIDSNNIRVTFIGAFSGKAYLN